MFFRIFKRFISKAVEKISIDFGANWSSFLPSRPEKTPSAFKGESVLLLLIRWAAAGIKYN